MKPDTSFTVGPQKIIETSQRIWIQADGRLKKITLNFSWGGRARNSGGTWSSQRQFGLAESFWGFGIFTRSKSKKFLQYSNKYL